MKKALILAISCMATTSAFAGGYLTNTNLSAAFLRNPARDGVIAIDGLYSNPAGVTFLSPGLHIQADWQAAFQHRNIDTEYAPFAYNIEHKNDPKRSIEGHAEAPVVPSVHASYNMERWNIGFMAGIVGGGGKCEFENGLSSFEQAASLLPILGQSMGITGYGMESYMRGKQFYLGFQLGAGYKVLDNLSVYAGLRATQAVCNYYGTISNIKMEIGGNALPAHATLTAKYNEQVDQVSKAYNLSFEQAEALVLQNQNGQLLKKAAGMTGDITLNCDQQGLGWAPVLSVDYQPTEALNLAIKYEFRTKMLLKNSSANDGGESLEALKQFEDGRKVREDIPAILGAGVQYSVMPQLRLCGGYHLYFDKDAQKYGNKQQLLDGNAWEALLGIEYDLNDNLTLSCGGQSTNYGNTDAYMSDLSFVTDSYSLGLGLAYKFNDNWTIDLGYFQTFYSDYTQKTVDANTKQAITNVYTRDNKVIGIGLTANF